VTPLDTSEEAAAVQREIWRRMGPEGRLRTALQMSDLTRSLFEAGFRMRNPGLTDAELKRAVIRALYGVEMPA
jgi:hypothetical protein